MRDPGYMLWYIFFSTGYSIIGELNLCCGDVTPSSLVWEFYGNALLCRVAPLIIDISYFNVMIDLQFLGIVARLTEAARRAWDAWPDLVLGRRASIAFWSITGKLIEILSRLLTCTFLVLTVYSEGLSFQIFGHFKTGIAHCIGSSFKPILISLGTWFDTAYIKLKINVFLV